MKRIKERPKLTITYYHLVDGHPVKFDPLKNGYPAKLKVAIAEVVFGCKCSSST